MSTVTSPSFTNSPDIKGKFLRATGAVRTVMVNNPQSLGNIIRSFREVDNLSVTSVLAFGARSDDYNVRLNWTTAYVNDTARIELFPI